MKKIYRINIAVSYLKGVRINQYRQPILDILTNIAWLYNLEYAISTNHNFHQDEGSADLVYFRSTDETRITKNELNTIITALFNHGLSIFDEGVEVCRQLYNALPQYPFPDEYCKPLAYPYVEFHNKNKSTLCAHEKAVQEVIDNMDDACEPIS